VGSNSYPQGVKLIPTGGQTLPRAG